MSLDDRLRGTYQRQLEEVRHTVRVSERDFVPDRRGPSSRMLPMTAAAAVVIVALVAASQLLPRPDTESIATADGAEADQRLADEPDGGAAPTPPTSSPTIQGSGSAATTATTSSVPATADPGPEPGSDPDFDSDSGAEDADGDPATTVETTASTADQDATATAVPGVANDVCPSGARAELEWAALRYIGQSRGWGRLGDLVDEQDGPYYFQAWEPNFDEPVAVEILMTDPVLASEVRVAQDPFTLVGGTIVVEMADRELSLELSGTGGWQVHRFDEPVLVDRLTVRRAATASNIMEILVCTVEP